MPSASGGPRAGPLECHRLWSFAFDGYPAPFDRRRFVSPAAAASAGTRAVVVWSGLRTWHGEPFFHLSVARDGAEQYAFTYADGEVRSSGEIPQALAPSRFFGDLEDGAEEERSLLEAVAGEFGAICRVMPSRTGGCTHSPPVHGRGRRETARRTR